MDRAKPVSLLQLPDPCLLAVLQCCANDSASLASAARAHSRLHQAAVLALGSMTAYVKTQQHTDSVLMYLSKHGHHVESLDVKGPRGDWFQEMQLPLVYLPPNLRLRSLKVSFLNVQLQPGSGSQGIVQPGAPLERLQLYGCTLLDQVEALAAALALLPGLQYLSVYRTFRGEDDLQLLADGFSGLQHLTYLELDDGNLMGPHKGFAPSRSAMQPLKSLTQLETLRLAPHQFVVISSSMFSGLQHLTHLRLASRAILEAVALGFATKLQHLELGSILGLAGTASAAAAQLLYNLHHLQHLTHLDLSETSCFHIPPYSNPPAAAFSAITASSKLQHLNIRRCHLPAMNRTADVWQFVFPADRQLPHLKTLDISYVKGYYPSFAAAPDGTRLVKCCPGLQSLRMLGLQYNAELLASLQQLSGLHTLALFYKQYSTVIVGGDPFLIYKDVTTLESVGQMTRLSELDLHADCHVCGGPAAAANRAEAAYKAGLPGKP